jgi:hypothetical protein
MGRSPYQSEKRRKELARLKKQEEKRQRRFNKKHGIGETDGTTDETGLAEGQEGQEGQVVDGEAVTAEPGDVLDAPQEKKVDSATD